LEDNLSHSVFIFIDLREYLHKTVDDFFTSVSEQMIVQSQGRVALARPFTSGVESFQSILSQFEKQNFYPVLLLDTFETIVNNTCFDHHFFSFLRALATGGKVSYITASIAPLITICHADIKGSPFFNIFATYSLEPFTEEEAYELITEPAQGAGRPFAEDEIEWILDLAGRHPFFLQQACRFFFEAKNKQHIRQKERVLIRRQIYHALKPFFEDIWSSLNKHQQRQLKEAIRQEVADRSLPELSESFLFRMFICNRFTIPTTEALLTVDELLRCLSIVECSNSANQLSPTSKAFEETRRRPYVPAAGLPSGDNLRHRVHPFKAKSGNLTNDDGSQLHGAQTRESP